MDTDHNEERQYNTIETIENILDIADIFDLRAEVQETAARYSFEGYSMLRSYQMAFEEWVK